MLPEFDLWMPKTLPEALERLAAGNAIPIAGGTNVVPDLRSGRHKPAALVNVAALPELRGIRLEEGCIVVGGGVTLSEVLASALIAEHAPILHAAAQVFASPLVRNRATIAGNLADGSPAADSAPPLLALEAEVDLASVQGTRRIPLREFFLHVRKTARRSDELITAVRWPVAPGKGLFHKVGLRRADAISVLSVAVQVAGDQVRIALGAVAPTPLRATAAEAALAGQARTAARIAEAATLAAQAACPIDDHRSSAAYRRRVVEALVRRLVTQLS